VNAIVAFRRTHPVLTRAILTVFWVSVALVATRFLSPLTNFNLAIGAAFSITILGLSFLTGASGQVSLGNGAFMGVGAYTVAIWANHHSNGSLNVIEELVLATLAGAIVGLLIGLPATRLRGPYLAGMTIAFAVAFPFILSAFSSWTGGDAPLTLPALLSPPQWVVSLFSSSGSDLAPTNMWLADISIVATGIAFFFMANLFRSRTGRAMRLVRENEVAAELSGVSLPRARVVAFMVSAACAGLGGGLWTLIQGSAQSTQFSLALSITILSLLVIGGIGTLSGALIGGLIYAYSQIWINWVVAQTNLNPTGNLATNLKGIIFGVALIAVMMLAPLGIAGTTRFVILRRLARRS
jgi:branched-chain amino acid transport system permease protein